MVDVDRVEQEKSISENAQKRNNGFITTHQQMIETAVRLISEKGVEALSVAAVARDMGINRTTVYYHFENRDALIEAVKSWSSEQLARAFSPERPQRERIDYISRFVLENPALIKLWIDDLVSVGNIREQYPRWDELVEGVRSDSAAREGDAPVDAEAFCVILLTSAFIGPRVFKNSVCTDDDSETLMSRYKGEIQRLLNAASLLKP